MSKLRYYFGCMGSMKSATLVMKSHNYKERGYRPVIMKPAYDTRDVGIIKPRPMEGVKVDVLFSPEDNLYNALIEIKTSDKEIKPLRKYVVFVDEIQFATKEHIKDLWEIAHKLNVDVYCYGLRINYLNKVFTPIQTLEVFADTQEELKTGCKYCENKATTHIFYIDNVPITVGNEAIVADLKGDEEHKQHYDSVCQECREKILGGL